MHLRRAGVALLCNVVVKENCGSNFILAFPLGHRDFNRDRTGIRKEDVDHIFVIL